MRIFIALDIEDIVRERIVSFMEGVRDFAPEARWVRPESLHVTLKFIGQQSAEAIEEIKQTLATVQCHAIGINFRGFGFFPSAQAPRVFWIGIEGGTPLMQLAAVVDETLAGSGIAKEEHDYNPHLTLARAGSSGSPRWRKGDAPNRSFEKLQDKLSSLPTPEFGTMTAHAFFLYQSQPGPGGSQYSKLSSFVLQ
jgi:RNA 2',3'-cyclic 3'-phosphodiesterase